MQENGDWRWSDEERRRRRRRRRCEMRGGRVVVRVSQL